MCDRGDLIHVVHDVTEWGTGWARVTRVSQDGSGVVSIYLDNEIHRDSGKSYRAQVRRGNGTQTRFDISGSDPRVLVATGAQVVPGDLVVVGEAGKEVAALLIKMIEPGRDATARITCVPADPGVWAVLDETPPPFVSNITGKLWCAPPPPPQDLIIVSGAESSVKNDAGVPTPSASVGTAQVKGGIIRPGAGTFTIREAGEAVQIK